MVTALAVIGGVVGIFAVLAFLAWVFIVSMKSWN